MLISLSFAALAGCGDREAPTAVPREAQRPTLTVVGADYVVTTTADAGAGSLRQSILDANAAGVAKTIGFDIPSSDAGCSAANVCTITLASTLPTITNSAGLTIDGTGQSITVSGNNAVRVMRVGFGAIATIRRLTITKALIAPTPEMPFTCGVPNEAVRSGAGICNEGTLTIDQSTFSLNQAISGFGGAIHNSGALTIAGSTFSGNQATEGGAISYFHSPSPSATITNSTFSSNGADTGGALFVYEGTELTVTNSTFAGNSASRGGSVSVQFSSLALRNSIVALSPAGANCHQLFSTVTDGGGNLSFGDATCPGINLDPKLGPLQVNGPGATATMALLEGSAAIDAAVDATCSATDQRGVTRPQGAHCDIGAYEVVPPDNTPPLITPTVSGNLGTNGWYKSDVTVSWTVTDAESAVSSQSGCGPTSISADTPGQTLTCSATSAGGTNAQSVTIKRDATAPTLVPVVSPNPVLLNGSATAAPNATDQMSGLASSSCATPTTTTVGGKSISCTATDQAGNTNTVAANYQVTYPFTGFLQPVDPMPTVNVVKGGSAVQVKFGLGGNQGLAIFAAGFPASQQVSCNASAPQDDIEATVTAGNSSLSYDASTQQYGYTWKSDKAWAGTCRILSITLVDGTTYQASFKFK